MKYLFSIFILLGSQAYAQKFTVNENNNAAKAIRLIEELKKYLAPNDSTERQLLELVQRNLTRKHVIENIYTSNVQSEVEKYLGSKIFTRADQQKTPVKVFSKKLKVKESVKEESDGMEKLNEIKKRVFRKGKKDGK